MKKLYAVRDIKAKSYGPVGGYAHEAVAVREFQLQCNNPESFLNKYPEDFELVCVGEFDDAPKGDAVICPVVGCEPVVVLRATTVRGMAEDSAQLSLLKKEA